MIQQRQISATNSTMAPLNNGQSFIPSGEVIPLAFSSVSVAIASDTDFKYFVYLFKNGN